jgi:RNA polymerase sigma factor (sigma-70 family)
MNAWDYFDNFAGAARRAGARDAEEVAAVACRKLWEKERRGTIAPWLRRIVLNGCLIDALRKQAREALVLVPAVHRPVEVEDLAFRESLYSALQRMPERMRQAWVLVNLRGLTHREAAEALGVSQPRITRLAEAARLRLVEEVVA